MNQNTLRRQAKAEARVRLLERLPQTMLAMLLYALPLTFIGIITGGGDGDDITRFAVLGGVSIAAEIVLTGPLSLGLMRYLLARSRGETAGIAMLFHPYGDLREAWRGVRMMVCIFVRLLLWLLIPAAIYIGGVYLTAPMFDLSSDMAYLTYLATATGLFLLLCIPAYCKACAYLAGYLEMTDDPSLGVWRATKLAAQRFRGHFRTLLALLLSFIPWLLLTLITYGVGTLIAMPYLVMSVFRMADLLGAQNAEVPKTEE